MSNELKYIAVLVIVVVTVLGSLVVIATPIESVPDHINAVTDLILTGNPTVQYVNMTFNGATYTVLVAGCIILPNTTISIDYSYGQGWYLPNCVLQTVTNR